MSPDVIPRLKCGPGKSLRLCAVPCRAHPSGSGFTLIEVVVALAIAGLVVLLASRVFGAAADASHALVRARAGLDREANARRWLAAAFRSLDVGQDSAGPFAGQEDRVEFSSWLETVDGSFARSRLALRADEGRFVVVATPGDTVALADSVESVAFDYLLEPGADTKWVRAWISPVSAPLGVRIRVQRSGGGRPEAGSVDTLLFLIGPRG